MKMSRKENAELFHEEGMELSARGEIDLALKKYFEALELDLERPTTFYNIGLIYKYRNQWRESFRYNQRATELNPSDEAANWNLAIAATALRDWETARAVWNSLHMPIERGDQIIEADFGITPIRLNPETDGEVVWARRLCPVRAHIESIPLPGSGFRYADVVLHDGAAVGYRVLANREHPVFNVLELFQASTFSTYEAELHTGRPEDIEALQKSCEALDIGFEDWGTSIRMLCKQCSEGMPHAEHDEKGDKPANGRYRIGMAATEEKRIYHVLDQWRSRERTVEQVACVLSARK